MSENLKSVACSAQSLKFPARMLLLGLLVKRFLEGTVNRLALSFYPGADQVCSSNLAYAEEISRGSRLHQPNMMAYSGEYLFSSTAI